MAYMARTSYRIEIACCTAIDIISEPQSSNWTCLLTSDRPMHLELGRKDLLGQDGGGCQMSGDFLFFSQKVL
jgi:hypothetical protein